MFKEQITTYKDFGSDLMSQVSSGLTGGAIGLGINAIGNLMQGNQQQKMTDMQLAANKELSAYNFAQQKNFWDQTNAEAQVEHLEKAGLNPALMYSKGGGPGGSTGSPTGGAGMGIASNPANNIQINPAVQADIKLKESQAKNIDADTAKKTGVDTDAVQAGIDQTKQLTQNAAIQNNILQWESGIKAAEATITTKTIDVAIQTLKASYEKLTQDIRSAKVSADINEKTKDDIIQQAANTTIQQGLNMILTKANTDNTIQNTQQIKTNIQAIIENNMRGWRQLDQKTRELQQRDTEIQIKEELKNIQMGDAIARNINNLISNILRTQPQDTRIIHHNAD